MTESGVVADASAVLAFLQRESVAPGFAAERLIGAAISAVNFSEVLATLIAGTLSANEADAAVAAFALRVVDFDQAQAHEAALLRASTRPAGLSLGDRACLALARRLGKPAVTADRAWTTVEHGAEVILLR